jgi:hypothetical protein
MVFVRLYYGPCAILRRSLHHFTLRIGDKEDKVSTLWGSNPALNSLRRLRSQGSEAARPPPSTSAIFPRQGLQLLAGYTSPRSSQQNCARNHFPLASHQGTQF